MTREEIINRIKVAAEEELAGMGVTLVVPAQPVGDAVIVQVFDDRGYVPVCVTGLEAHQAKYLDDLILQRVMTAAQTLKEASRG